MYKITLSLTAHTLTILHHKLPISLSVPTQLLHSNNTANSNNCSTPIQTPTQTTPTVPITSSPTPAPQPQSGIPVETLFIISVAVIIIAILAVAAVLLRNVNECNKNNHFLSFLFKQNMYRSEKMG